MLGVLKFRISVYLLTRLGPSLVAIIARVFRSEQNVSNLISTFSALLGLSEPRFCDPKKKHLSKHLYNMFFIFDIVGKEHAKILYHKGRVAVISAKTHKRQRRQRQSATAKREKSLTPKFLTAILTLPNLT